MRALRASTRALAPSSTPCDCHRCPRLDSQLRQLFFFFIPIPIPPTPPLPLRPSSSSLPRSLLTGPSLPLDPIEIHGCSPREPPACCGGDGSRGSSRRVLWGRRGAWPAAASACCRVFATKRIFVKPNKELHPTEKSAKNIVYEDMLNW